MLFVYYLLSNQHELYILNFFFRFLLHHLFFLITVHCFFFPLLYFSFIGSWSTLVHICRFDAIVFIIYLWSRKYYHLGRAIFFFAGRISTCCYFSKDFHYKKIFTYHNYKDFFFFFFFFMSSPLNNTLSVLSVVKEDRKILNI
jgi:hypothetical protein